jgi:L-ribulokinase
LKAVIGIDFGTESARALLVNLATGEPLATAVHRYADGVIDRELPGSGVALPPNWALQNPADWLAATEATVRAVMAQSGLDEKAVVGIGIDFTGCSLVPTTRDGTPLCEVESWRGRPHAWAKLWKHHGAQGQADRITELAKVRRERFLPRHGGKYSSEWVMSKGLQMLEEDPSAYEAARFIVEGGDWVAWRLTGSLVRNACAAGYKGTWHQVDGWPSREFLAALNPGLVGLYGEKFAGPVVAPGTRVGGLRADWARRLGLCEGTPVGAAIIDAHAAVPGGAVSGPGVLFMIMGTSTCHMLMADREVLVEGISGVVEGGILPGLFGYEAGQVGVGDIFAWYVEESAPPEVHAEAARSKTSLHTVLSERAASLRPGQSGLLALDWWNGCRSTLVDAELSGMLVGYTLTTRPEEVYRALVEATAFGTRTIIEAFTSQGVEVGSVVAGGGLTQNPMLMQVYADVTEREIAVAGAEQVSALGAAMLGAVAAGECATLVEAAKRMAPPPTRVYRPIADHRAPYEALYREYTRLYDYFGRGENGVMKTLMQLKREVFARRDACGTDAGGQDVH